MHGRADSPGGGGDNIRARGDGRLRFLLQREKKKKEEFGGDE